MEKKEYLNEENYERGKKKIKKIALIVLIAGITIGLGLIITGAVLSHNAKGVNVDLNSHEKDDVALRSESEVQADINTIKSKINSLENQISVLDFELLSIQMDEGLNDNYYAKQKEKETKESELLNLNTQLKNYQNELIKIQSSNSGMNNQIDKFENIFNTTSNKISKAKYTPFYMFGAFIIIASCMVSGVLYLFSKKREIAAFTIQQTMPLAQEGIDKMSPTVGNATGNIAKGITKGIKDGLKDDE